MPFHGLPSFSVLLDLLTSTASPEFRASASRRHGTLSRIRRSVTSSTTRSASPLRSNAVRSPCHLPDAGPLRADAVGAEQPAGAVARARSTALHFHRPVVRDRHHGCPRRVGYASVRWSTWKNGSLIRPLVIPRRTRRLGSDRWPVQAPAGQRS